MHMVIVNLIKPNANEIKITLILKDYGFCKIEGKQNKKAESFLSSSPLFVLILAGKCF
jgi:hypothetical protein